MKTRIFSAAMMMAMTFAISCNDDTVSPQGPAGLLQENAVLVHAVMAEGMTKVTLGDDSGASTQVHWDTDDKIGIRIDETTYTFDRTDDAVGSKTADFEYKAGGVALPTLTAGEYTFTYPATGKVSLVVSVADTVCTVSSAITFVLNNDTATEKPKTNEMNLKFNFFIFSTSFLMPYH